MKQEEQIKASLSLYLSLQYPKLIYRYDIGADIHLPIGLAKKSKRIHKHKRGYPDLFIAEPKGKFAGFYIEIKKDKFEVFKKNGGLKKSNHLFEQIETLNKLKQKGYCVAFAFGTDDAITKIDAYMDNKTEINEINKRIDYLYIEMINEYFETLTSIK